MITWLPCTDSPDCAQQISRQVLSLASLSVVLFSLTITKTPVNGNQMVLVNLTETETNAITLT